jgi:PAS domain S-box-containing protein
MLFCLFVYSLVKGLVLFAFLTTCVIVLLIIYRFVYNKGQLRLAALIYQRLFNLIASLKLESHQRNIELQYSVRTLNQLDSLLTDLEKAIESKTNDLINKNDQLKIKQHEILHQNKELLAAYDALKESRERYEKLVKNLEEEYFFYGVGLNEEILYVSPSVQTILGYSVQDYKKKVNENYTKNPLNILAKEYRKKILQGQLQPRFNIEITDAACKNHVMEVLEIPIFNSDNQVVSIEGLAHDITERYYAEELIKEKEEKYRQVFNSASDFIFIYEIKKDNKAGNFIEANEYTVKYLGYSHDELLQKTPDELVAAEIWTGAYDRRPNEKYERIWETKDGIVINVEISERYFKIKNKTVCIAVARDITDRKRAVEEIKFMNEELINQKENLEALLDNLTQTQEQLVQSEKMAALGQLIAGVAHEINTPLGAIKASVGNLSDSLNSALSKLPALVQDKSADNLNLFIKSFERARIKTPDLSTREKREKKKAVRKDLRDKAIEPAELVADILGYLDIYENYDELIPLLRNNDALATLNSVRDFISLYKNTHTIEIASDKASKVVFALKKYAHRDTIGEKVPTDIIDGIETILTLYDNQIKQGVTVVKEYTTLPLAMCYQDEINQVWSNLVQNSLQAMGQIGTLTISASADEEKISVSISDTGEGIEPNIMDKIFDPFFTTKKQGEGSGLGLDIVKKIIDKHNGDILVKSKINEGSTFTVILPLY